jgi:hypothetical protein
VYNYYCLVGGGTEELALDYGQYCELVSAPVKNPVCSPVQAFIDTTGINPPNVYPPIFYRCYWKRAAAFGNEVISFEWSATTEWITHYATTLGIPQKVPLLCVTNHTPS